MRKLLKYFTTTEIGIIGAILFHGGLLIFFLSSHVEGDVLNPERKIKKKKQEVELTIDSDFVLEQEESVAQPEDEKVPQDIKNVVVDENDDREQSMEDFSSSPYDNNKNLDEQVNEELSKLEKEVIQQRREQGYEMAPEYESEQDQNSSNNEDNSTNPAHNASKKAYAGTATVSYNLKDRSPRKQLDVPAWTCKQSGTVVVNIQVDQIGEIVKTEINEYQSTPNACLRRQALQYAQREVFNRDGSKPKKQQGTITYQFIGQ